VTQEMTRRAIIRARGIAAGHGAGVP
jgi:hypothetical protein